MALRHLSPVLREPGFALRQSVERFKPAACPAQGNARLADRHAGAVCQTQRPSPSIALATRYGMICDPRTAMNLRTTEMGQIAYRIFEAVVREHRPSI